jgi:tRNA-dihydrouridine synthase C
VAGYAPPIHWGPIGRVRERLGIPVVANGDIWTLDGFRRCREETGCRHFMLGRGALADPRLAPDVAAELGLRPAGGGAPLVADWPARLRGLIEADKHVGRLKQWLKMAATVGTFERFDAVKRAESVEELFAALEV